MELNKKASKRLLTLLMVIAIYLSIELIQINLGGLFFDEAIDGVMTFRIMKNDFGAEGIKIFNRTLPLMISVNHSALTAYFILPFFYLLGINTISLRLLPISFGALTLLFTYFFTKDFLNYQIAIMSTLLLALNFTFILQTKLGIMHGSTMLAIMMFSLLCFFKWYQHRRKTYFYIGAFLLGVGLSIKFWFIWYIMALSICSLVFRGDIKRRVKEKRNCYLEIIFGFIFFIIGGTLLFYYNIFNGFPTLKGFFKNFVSTGEAHLNNFRYLNNLFLRINHISDLLKSKIWEFEGNSLSLIFYLLPLCWLIYILIFKKKTLLPKKRILFVLIIAISILLLSPFSSTSLKWPHLFLLFPFPILLVSIGVIEFNFYFKRKIMTILTVLLFFSFLFIEINKSFRSYVFLKQTGGKGYLSDAVNKLAEWLIGKNDYNKIIILSGKFYDSLIILSGGRLYKKVIDYTYPCHLCKERINMSEVEIKRLIQELEKLVKERNNLYIEAVPADYKFWSCDEIFFDILEKNKLEAYNEKNFAQKDDNVILFRVFSIREKANEQLF